MPVPKMPVMRVCAAIVTEEFMPLPYHGEKAFARNLQKLFRQPSNQRNCIRSKLYYCASIMRSCKNVSSDNGTD